MRKTFIALAFIAIIVGSTMLPEDRLKATASLVQLQQSRAGKNILTSIQLILTSENTENVVDRILTLLNDLLNDTNDKLNETEVNLQTTTDYCVATAQSYADQISAKEAQIAQGLVDLPNLRLQLASAQANLKTEQDKVQQAQSDLDTAALINVAAVAAYKKSTKNHNTMINALTQAALLKAQQGSFAEIEAHTSSSMSSLASHPARDIFLVFMQMKKQVMLQASSSALDRSLVDISNDLLAHEKQALVDEAAYEAERQQDYNDLVQALNDVIDQANNNILDLQSQIVNLNNDIATLINDLANWNDQLNSLNELLNSLNELCASQIQQLNDDIVELNSEIEVIEDAVAVFEGNSIQEIKSVVDGLEVSE